MAKSFTSEQGKYQVEDLLLLLEGSLKSIPFNMILGVLLCIDLLYNSVPLYLVGSWFLAITLVSIIRFIFSKVLLKRDPRTLKAGFCIWQFTLLTFLTGIVWGACYFLFLPYVSLIQEFIIILVLGGMAAGAIASLSVFLIAYYVYILPIFVPLIVYNFYLFYVNRIVMAIMFTMFVLMLMMTARINSLLLQQTLRLGKEKDALIGELQEANRKQEKSIEEIKMLSITDFLTGLYNRRHFTASLQNEFNRAKREHYLLTLIFIDIDNFKYINDNFGHPCGDRFLIQVANGIKSCVHRASDSVFRLGGDEFAIIIINQSLDEAMIVCRRIQEQFRKQNRYKEISLSLGVISIASDQVLDFEEIITMADNALYEAKKTGKNAVISKFLPGLV